MKKRLLLGLVAVLLVGTAVLLRLHLSPPTYNAAPTDQEFRAEFKRVHGNPQQEVDVAKPLDPSHAVRVAIGSLGLADQSQNRDVADLAVVNLTGTRGMEMVERGQLDAALQEMQLSLSQLVRASDAIKVGKLLRADWFLLGTPARINGTNFIVVRIVDARTGILQDGCGLAVDQSPQELSKKLADFVRQCRQLATTGVPRVYLALGTFQDLSLNSRAAALPQQLRSYLMAAYRGSSVTLLEREFVSTLLKEVNLDLAGLTEGGTTNAPAPMQAAYWMVDGYYQTYETTNKQVQLVLGVQKIFGTYTEVQVQAELGEPVFRQAKEAVDQTMRRNSSRVIVSRVSEIRAQFAQGKHLAGISTGPPFGDLGAYIFVSSSYEVLPRDEWARRQRNMEEAMRAFQTVLLLDPTNREAKLCIATCLRVSYMQRIEEARDIYREIIEAGVMDHWDDVARRALDATFGWNGYEAKQHWFEGAAQTAGNTPAGEFYRQEAKAAAREAVLEKGGTTEAEKLAEQRLFVNVKKLESEVGGQGFMNDFYNVGLRQYTESFGTNSAEAATRLVAFLPRLLATSPKSAPYLLAGVTSYQVDTNAAIIKDFSDSLAHYTQHPEELPSTGDYFQLIAGPLNYWSRDNKLFGLMAQLFESCQTVAGMGYIDPLDDEKTMTLGYAYMGAGQWQKALALFDSYSNRPVYLGNGGLWGPAFSEVLTSEQAALCRQKLGLPPKRDPRELKLDPQHLSLNALAFTCDNSGLWVAAQGQLFRLNFDFETNFALTIPLRSFSRATTICAGVSNLWIGTGGSGIVEFDKSTREFRQFTEADGLFMNSISCLHLDGQTLWIGYGSQRGGGIGRMDIKSHAVTSFSPSPAQVGKAVCQPPGAGIESIFTSSNGDPWVKAGGSIYHDSLGDNSWEIISTSGSPGSILVNQDHLLASLSSTFSGWKVRLQNIPTDGQELIATNIIVSNEELTPLYRKFNTNHTQKVIDQRDWRSVVNTLRTYSLSAKHWETNLQFEALPHSPSTFNYSGNTVWAGGEGFIAAIDATTGKITKLAFIPCTTVHHVETGGGYVWASFNGDTYSGFDGAIYRAVLTN
jgi:hypothetical protein